MDSSNKQAVNPDDKLDLPLVELDGGSECQGVERGESGFGESPEGIPEECGGDDSVPEGLPGSLGSSELLSGDLQTTGDVHFVNYSALRPSELMTCKVEAMGKQLHALMDTGAQRSMIALSVARSLDLPLDMVAPPKIKGIGGANWFASIGIVSFPLTFHGCRMDCVGYVVVPDDRMPNSCDLVLGFNFFCVNNLSINVNRKRVTHYSENHDHIVWQIYLDDGESCTQIHHEVNCFAATDVLVPVGEKVIVPIWWSSDKFVNRDLSCTCCSAGSQDRVFLAQKGGRANKYLELLPGLTDLEGEGVRVVVLTHGVVPLAVKKGDPVGVLATVVDVPSTIADICDSSFAVGTAVDVAEDNGGEGQTLVHDWTLPDIENSIEIGPILTENQRDQVFSMIYSKRLVLSKDDNDMGFAGVLAHRIELYDDTPIRQRPRRLPEPLADAIEQQCLELEALDIIEPSNSPWSSPIVPLRKKDGSIRLCVDYRKLNLVTKPDRFPMPNLNDAVFNLHGTKFFTSLDLVRGYYQMPIEESSRELTAFTTPRNHWQFKRLSFGLKNAPAAFQREMQEVLKIYPWKNVIVYIDDILIMSETYEEHLDLVGKVLGTLANYGIKIKPAKCSWFQPRVKFLGHIVSQTGLSKPPEYVDRIKDYPKPVTVRELREFLGLINFQRKFVPDCSSIAKPLSELTGGKRNAKLRWTDHMEEAFETLKSVMQEEVELAFPDYSKDANKLELYVDASGTGSGACLMQMQEEKKRIIAFASMTFSNAQRKYSTTERELAAVRWGVKAFRAFLYGSPFILYTDHMALLYLHNMKHVDSRLARTNEDLAAFDYEIRYQPGRENQAADALSRLRALEVPPGNFDTLLKPDFLPDGLSLFKTSNGGGDSLFESLLTVLHAWRDKYELKHVIPKDCLELRKVLVNMVLKDVANYCLKPSKDLTKALLLMLQPGQLPLWEVVLAFSSLYQVSVWVHYGGSRPIIFRCNKGLTEGKENRLHLQCLAGIHFNPVREEDIFCQNREEELKVTCALSQFVDYPKPKLSDAGPLDTEGLGLVDVGSVQLQDTLPCSKSGEGQVIVSDVANRTAIFLDLVGETFLGLLDTGAEISIVSNSAFDVLNAHNCIRVMRMTNRVQIRGFGSGTLYVKRVALVSFASSRLSCVSFPFAVMDDDVSPYDFIFGANFMAAHDVEVKFPSAVAYENNLRPLEECRVTEASGSLCAIVKTRRQTADDLETSRGEDVVLGEELLEKEPQGKILLSKMVSQANICALQKRDCMLSQLRRHIVAGRSKEQLPPRLGRYKRYLQDLRVVDEALLYSADGFERSVVSFSFLVEVVSTLHFEMGHIGRNKLVNLVNKHVWHPSLYKVVEDVCFTCDQCQRMKVSPQTIKPPTLRIASNQPFELVGVDLISLPRTQSGNIGCLVVIDHFSKWLKMIPITNKSSKYVAGLFVHSVLPSLLKCPDRVLSDNGPEFVGPEFVGVLEQYGIRHVKITPGMPSSNGVTERVNRSMIQFIRSLEATDKWDVSLGKAVMIYNATYHSEIKMTPAECLLTQAHNLGDHPIVPDAVQQSWKPGHPNFASFKLGQNVLKKIPKKGHLNVNKFAALYGGPYRVVRVQDQGVSYRISHPDTGVEYRAHHSQLKAWRRPPEYLQRHLGYRRYLLAERGELSRNEDTILGNVSERSCESLFESDLSGPLSGFEGFPSRGVGCPDVDDNTARDKKIWPMAGRREELWGSELSTIWSGSSGDEVKSPLRVGASNECPMISEYGLGDSDNSWPDAAAEPELEGVNGCRGSGVLAQGGCVVPLLSPTIMPLSYALSRSCEACESSLGRAAKVESGVGSNFEGFSDGSRDLIVFSDDCEDLMIFSDSCQDLMGFSSLSESEERKHQGVQAPNGSLPTSALVYRGRTIPEETRAHFCDFLGIGPRVDVVTAGLMLLPEETEEKVTSIWNDSRVASEVTEVEETVLGRGEDLYLTSKSELIDESGKNNEKVFQLTSSIEINSNVFKRDTPFSPDTGSSQFTFGPDGTVLDYRQVSDLDVSPVHPGLGLETAHLGQSSNFVDSECGTNASIEQEKSIYSTIVFPGEQSESQMYYELCPEVENLSNDYVTELEDSILVLQEEVSRLTEVSGGSLEVLESLVGLFEQDVGEVRADACVVYPESDSAKSMVGITEGFRDQDPCVRVSKGVESASFVGFVPSLAHNPDRLVPIKAALHDLKLMMEASAQRSRERTSARKRYLRSLGPQTRSQGVARELPNVQARTLEYSNRKS